MPRTDSVLRFARVAALLLVALPVAVLTSRAALKPKVDNPHGAFKEECALCHDARGWNPAHVSHKFDHARYGFRLEGAHASAECLACHGGLEFKQPKFLCASCHEDPHHAEMGVDCARCHTARSFVDRAAMVRAHQLTRMPLTGSHAALECESCHRPAAQGQMQFVGTRAECSGCHMKDYGAATQPEHRSAGFPTDCEQCHRTLSWNNAKFDHDRTAFPLTGAHRSATCLQCHGDGVWAGKSTACVSCHQSDFNGATNPNHVSAGFSNACATCHNTTAWQPSTFDHDGSWFPIYSGRHAGAWTQCSQCHQVATNFASFTCLTCHPHDDRPGTDSRHTQVSGYTYDSPSCYRCHPRGQS